MRRVRVGIVIQPPDAPEPRADVAEIEPDTKDWTWVLEAPCAECGFVAGSVGPTDLPALVLGWVERWERVLKRSDVAVRPVPTTWSPLEYACHVRDVLIVFDGRVRLMLEQDGPVLANWDQDATAVAERYDEQDPTVVAVELRAAGKAIAATFTAVPPQPWVAPACGPTARPSRCRASGCTSRTTWCTTWWTSAPEHDRVSSPLRAQISCTALCTLGALSV